MKTAISLPDDTFQRASQRAIELGMSRSEFFARAAERFLDDLDAASVTAKIDAALAHIGGPDDATLAVVEASRRALADGAEDW